MIKIALYEGVSAFEAASALAAARASGLDAEWVGEEALVPTHEGARLVPARLGWAALEAAACAVVPGGDVAMAARDVALAKALRARRGKWTLASGEAVALLHAVGLAEGRRVARRPGAAPLPGTTPQHARLVADGRLLTGADADATLDLVLHYVAHAHGDAAARAGAEALGREYRVFALGATE